MWGEAVRAAAYIINRSPTQSLKVTPHQFWTGKKPNLSNCRIFGYKTYAKELGNLKTLDEQSKLFVFVGYSPNGYRLWDATKGKLVIRREFDERKRKLRKENDRERFRRRGSDECRRVFGC